VRLRFLIHLPVRICSQSGAWHRQQLANSLYLKGRKQMTLVLWPPLPPHWVTAIREGAANTPVVTPANEDEARVAAAEAEGWIGRLTPDLLEHAPCLRWLQAPSISLESVVFPDLAASDVLITNMRHIYDDLIATHVAALFLALCRDLARLARRQAEKVWLAESAVQVRAPEDMTALILGLGGIGAETARRLAVFGPRIIGVDPKVTTLPPGVAAVHAPDQLPMLLPDADAVIICAPLTPETTGLFGDALFARMRRGALFINIGRGKIVHLDALTRALQSGQVGGAALDVFETEPLPPAHPLWEMENVIITPHSAGYGPHTEARRLAVVVENVRRFVADQPLANIADKQRWY